MSTSAEMTPVGSGQRPRPSHNRHSATERALVSVGEWSPLYDKGHPILGVGVFVHGRSFLEFWTPKVPLPLLTTEIPRGLKNNYEKKRKPIAGFLGGLKTGSNLITCDLKAQIMHA